MDSLMTDWLDRGGYLSRARASASRASRSSRAGSVEHGICARSWAAMAQPDCPFSKNRWRDARTCAHWRRNKRQIMHFPRLCVNQGDTPTKTFYSRHGCRDAADSPGAARRNTGPRRFCPAIEGATRTRSGQRKFRSSIGGVLQLQGRDRARRRNSTGVVLNQRLKARAKAGASE